MYGLFEKALRFALLYLSLSLSVAVLRTTHEKKSNTMIVVYTSIIHTVNNGKTWSMTVLYAYIQYGIAWSFKKALAPIFTVRTLNLLSVLVVLSPHEPHTMIPRILEEQHDDLCLPLFIICNNSILSLLIISPRR